MSKKNAYEVREFLNKELDMPGCITASVSEISVYDPASDSRYIGFNSKIGISDCNNTIYLYLDADCGIYEKDDVETLLREMDNSEYKINTLVNIFTELRDRIMKNNEITRASIPAILDKIKERQKEQKEG